MKIAALVQNAVSFVMRWEKWLFLTVALLHLIPLFSGTYFGTMDGPAHLYNSNLINELLFFSNDKLDVFYSFTTEPVPNYTGHIVLSFFNLFLPAFLAEKILLVAYALGMAYAFRALIKVIRPENKLLSYFIFPFIYSFVFLLGFFNFSISLIFLFLTIRYWLIHRENLTYKKVLVLCVFLTLTYFSHLFGYTVLLFILGCYILFRNLGAGGPLKSRLGKMFRNAGFLLLAAFPTLILFGYYFYTRPPTGNDLYIPTQELLDWFKPIRPIVAYNQEVEGVYTKKIFYAIVVVFIAVLVERISRLVKPVDGDRQFFRLNDLWFITTLGVFALYMYLPNSNGSAGFISARFGLMIFILFIIWMATHKLPQWLLMICSFVVVLFNFGLDYSYRQVQQTLNILATDLVEVAEHIPENSTVLPLNYSDNWLTIHFPNYMGIDKPLAILENYECNTGYFPLTWDLTSLGPELHSAMLVRADQNIHLIQPEASKIKVEYVMILQGDKNPDIDSITNLVEKHYKLVYSNRSCTLYELNGE